MGMLSRLVRASRDFMRGSRKTALYQVTKPSQQSQQSSEHVPKPLKGEMFIVDCELATFLTLGNTVTLSFEKNQNAFRASLYREEGEIIRIYSLSILDALTGMFQQVYPGKETEIN